MGYYNVAPEKEALLETFSALYDEIMSTNGANDDIGTGFVRAELDMMRYYGIEETDDIYLVLAYGAVYSEALATDVRNGRM